MTPDLCICGHARNQHEYLSDLYPAICSYAEPRAVDDDTDLWEGVCLCLHYEAEPSESSAPAPMAEMPWGPGAILSAGQGPGCPIAPLNTPGSRSPDQAPPAAVAPVPGRATTHLFHSSPTAAQCSPASGGMTGEARDTNPVACPVTPAHQPSPGARADRNPRWPS